MPSRRQVLGLTATSLTLSIPGCSAVDSSLPTTYIGESFVVNHCNEPHTIHIRVDEDGEEVYREAVEMEAAPESDQKVDAIYEMPPPLPTSAGKYRVYVRLSDDDTWTAAKTVDSGTCVEYTFAIYCGVLDGGPEPHAGIRGSLNDDDCQRGG